MSLALLSYITDYCSSVRAARFLQRPLAKLISSLRAPKSSEGYKRIGGGSPLRRITEQQADALAAALKTEGLDAKVYVGMRYWSPFIEDAMDQVGFPLSLRCLALLGQFHNGNCIGEKCMSCQLSQVQAPRLFFHCMLEQ